MNALQKQLRRCADPKRVKASQRYFKTGSGQYGKGDRFIGVTVPQVRAVARAHATAELSTITSLLASPFHEDRLLALHILVLQARKADPRTLDKIARFYLRHRRSVNNWDLVDVSARDILGPYFLHRSKKKLYGLLKSRRLWDRRIAVLTTFDFIRQGHYKDSLALAERLLADPEDLLHKAVGWILREIGKRDRSVEKAFLDRHAPRMPRTMLRYAIEHLPPAERAAYRRA